MKRIEFKRGAVVQAAVIGAASVLALIFCVSQRLGIGQTYQSVMIDGSMVGYTAADLDVKGVIQAARREVSVETGMRYATDFSWESRAEKRLFQKFMSEDALKEAVKEIIVKEAASNEACVRVYTVAVEGYRANFTSLEEVETFLEKVKAPADENGEYEVAVYKNDYHFSSILNAVLVKKASDEENKESVAGAQQTVNSGVLAAAADALEYAMANPFDESYETGILDMEFVERIDVYENYVHASEISDIDEQVIEVTKQKESNKIYEVVSGDCLSIIAMDHDTTMDSIVALNGLEDQDAMIRVGQELIIAVPEPDLKLRIEMGEVYEEDYSAEPEIIENDSWYTTKEVVHQEGTVGHRERNDIVVYENGMEISREMVHENIMAASTPAVIERGTIIPPTYIKPLSGGRFTSGFGRRWGRLHKGTDWACPVGTTVYASCGGTVIQASYNGGYGNNVVISHPDGRMTRYAHNSKLLVKVGQHVEQGEPIALSGNTGRSTGPHVHFEMYINGAAVDAQKYIQ